MQEINEKRLVRNIQKGCKESMLCLYQMHKDNLLTLANALLNNRSEAEDVVHDVFVSFVKSIDTFKVKKSLRSYLGTCVCNLARDKLRSQKRHSEKMLDYDTSRQITETPEKLISAQETNQLIRNALEQVPFEQREVVLLHIKTGLTFKKIASATNASINTVQGRYRYGIERLRSILNSEAIK